MAERVAQIYPGFSALLDAIGATSTAAADATKLTGIRSWHYPPLSMPASCTWSGDPYDLPGMICAFDRKKMNDDLITIFKRKGQKIGESMVVTIIIEYISALERAFRTRHASYVRCKMHSAARRVGHGASNGPIRGVIVTWLNRLLEGAFDDPAGEEGPNGRTS